MDVGGKHFRTIWVKEGDSRTVCVIDQRMLPFEFVVEELSSVDDFSRAIKDMHVRGAGLIGAAAGYGVYMAALEAEKTDDFDGYVKDAVDRLKKTRPTAVNLAWAVDRQLAAMKKGKNAREMVNIAFQTAQAIADEDAEACRKIGEHGLDLIEELSRRKKGDVVNILTHCNAGWLAFVDYGSATAPIYAAFDKGIKVHVWVDETRPRNQGARLTAWELLEHGVPHTVIPDNAGGHLMQHGMVDLVIVGADRVTRTGDVANKVGTYLKALAAHDNGVAFYAALPSSTFDWKIRDGMAEIPIEERNADEVRFVEGLSDSKPSRVLVMPEKSRALNYGFDVTPSRLVTGIITERGVCEASEKGILSLFPDNGDFKEEGYIKFDCRWTKSEPADAGVVKIINKWRDKLYKIGLVGAYDNGIGFGNLSVRMPYGFVITGSATGNYPVLGPEHYSIVTEYDFESNVVVCKGPVRASSESLTHAAVYESYKSANAVIHVHSLPLWENLKSLGFPTTDSSVSYGTPEMAREVERLFAETDAASRKIIVMGGHKEGVLAFGKNLDEAGAVLLDEFRKLKGD